MPEEPLSHIRRPDLPWREARITECGRGVNDVAEIMSRADALALVDKHGIKRAAFLLCMTCMTTCNQYATWEQSPADALGREFFGVKDPALDDELTAIGLLVAAHRDEFDDYLRGVKAATSLEAARRRRAAGRRR